MGVSWVYFEVAISSLLRGMLPCVSCLVALILIALILIALILIALILIALILIALIQVASILIASIHPHPLSIDSLKSIRLRLFLRWPGQRLNGREGFSVRRN
jgi:hypothetical protein